MNLGGPDREWKDARAKVDDVGVCRACGKTSEEAPIEADHTIGRKYDNPMTCPTCDGDGRALAGAGRCTSCKGRGFLKILYVKPEAIVPLCGPQSDPNSCHGKKHRGELDLLPLLELDEQLYAVEMLGGIALAYDRLTKGGIPS